jgi:hypothetical protein
LLACFALTLFLSAFLLFLVQPMVAKMVLPALGGSPAVWNTCMVFFQAALLAGYAYAHAAPAWLGSRRQKLLHLALLAVPAVALPIGIADWVPPEGDNPVGWLLLLLTVAVGLPFFVVATIAPTLQKWLADSGHPAGQDPYFLYAASNLGSLLALAAYPVLVEPRFRLAQQSAVWTAGDVFLGELVTLCAFLTWRSTPLNPPHSSVGPERSADPLAPRDRPLAPRLSWLAWAFVPSSMMLGVTAYVTTDLAAVPLLWVIPLGLYLLSFIVAFSRLPVVVHRVSVVLLPAAVLALVIVRPGADVPLSRQIGLHLAAFFVTALVCHGELARSRPAAGRLTEFYLWVSVGGVLGGLFSALVAPAIFNRLVEYPLVIVAACLLVPGLRRMVYRPQAGSVAAGPPPPEWLRVASPAAWVLFGVVAGGFIYQRYYGLDPALVVRRERNFFGIIRVGTDDRHEYHFLTHGSTLHGVQSLDPTRRGEPMGYYHREGPVGQVFEVFSGPAAKKRVGVVGLGAGTLACYAEPGQEWTFYEIDPAVENVARDRRCFTYLSECESRGVDVRVVLGDARLKLKEAPGGYGLLVLDAFSSDSIPMHLVTREALRLYVRKLAPEGVLAFHISNKYLRLPPVLADLAHDAGLEYRYQVLRASREEFDRGVSGSQWVVMARRAADLGPIWRDERWRPAQVGPGRPVWTDDYSNLLGVFQWH